MTTPGVHQYYLMGLPKKPGEDMESYRKRATDCRDMKLIRHLRFVEFMDAKMIQLRVPHRSVQWVTDVYMNRISPGV